MFIDKMYRINRDLKEVVRKLKQIDLPRKAAIA
jgi:hypothetical protein